MEGIEDARKELNGKMDKVGFYRARQRCEGVFSWRCLACYLRVTVLGRVESDDVGWYRACMALFVRLSLY